MDRRNPAGSLESWRSWALADLGKMEAAGKLRGGEAAVPNLRDPAVPKKVDRSGWTNSPSENSTCRAANSHCRQKPTSGRGPCPEGLEQAATMLQICRLEGTVRSIRPSTGTQESRCKRC